LLREEASRVFDDQFVIGLIISMIFKPDGITLCPVGLSPDSNIVCQKP